VYVAQPRSTRRSSAREGYLKDDAAKEAFLAPSRHKHDFQPEGLGEMDFDELRETTIDPTKRSSCRSASSRRPWLTRCLGPDGEDVELAASSSRATQRTCASSTSEAAESIYGKRQRRTGIDRKAAGRGHRPVIGFIEPIEIQEEMERSFLEYSMSVIVSRALLTSVTG